MKFLFLSGVLALDLVNTEIIARGKKFDLFSSPADLARWWQGAIAHHPDAEYVKGEISAIEWSQSLLEDVKQIRAAIRTLCTNLVEHQPFEPEALAMLNTILAMGYPVLEATSEYEFIATYHARDSEGGILLLSVALSALRLFTQAEKQRLHKCKNERCILFFYDGTRSATRQWCSLECMNRARSVQHYQGIKNRIRI